MKELYGRNRIRVGFRGHLGDECLSLYTVPLKHPKGLPISILSCCDNVQVKLGVRDQFSLAGTHLGHTAQRPYFLRFASRRSSSSSSSPSVMASVRLCTTSTSSIAMALSSPLFRFLRRAIDGGVSGERGARDGEPRDEEPRAAEEGAGAPTPAAAQSSSNCLGNYGIDATSGLLLGCSAGPIT